MKIMYKQDVVNKVPLKFERAYTNGAYNRLDIIRQLKDLPIPIDAEVVDSIIGNTSWTAFNCDNCNKDVNKLIYIADIFYDGYEGPNIRLCKECVTEANKLFSKED